MGLEASKSLIRSSVDIEGYICEGKSMKQQATDEPMSMGEGLDLRVESLNVVQLSKEAEDVVRAQPLNPFVKLQFSVSTSR